MSDNSYSVVIIGGGPAGMMAALSAAHHHPDFSVAVIEGKVELGRKMIISGAGRGNLTNVNIASDAQRYFSGNRELLTSVFSQFGYQDIEAFFLRSGIPLYVEEKSKRGKVFPVIDHAKTVRDILVENLKGKNVTVSLNTKVNGIKRSQSEWLTETSHGVFRSRYVILAAGGQTYPALGSDGSGYVLAEKLGHRLIRPVPSAVPLVSKNMLSHYLQGEKMNMKARAKISGSVAVESAGDVMFTKYGFSGPAILDISRPVSIRINRDGKCDTEVILSFFPNIPDDGVLTMLEKRWKDNPGHTVARSLWGILTQKAAGAICAVSSIPKERFAGEMTIDEKRRLFQTLTSFEARITETRGWNEAEFTAGGIDTGEIDPQSLSSKMNEGLYFAGEILDIDGMVGGYNLSWAWSSGWVAGKLL